jgi:hypothetical protein
MPEQVPQRQPNERPQNRPPNQAKQGGQKPDGQQKQMEHDDQKQGAHPQKPGQQRQQQTK